MTKHRAPPREERDLYIATTTGYVLAYDNLSHMPDWLSDAFCRIATGGGYGTRELYSDAEEKQFDAMRPIVFDGVEEVVTKSDLADRSIALQPAPIGAKRRRTEEEFWQEFDSDHPRILGALLDGVVHGLRELPHVQREPWPRMADFAKWATACEGAYWDPGTFRLAYLHNRRGMTRDVIEADMVASAILRFMTCNNAPEQWKGTATQLLVALESLIGEKETKLRQPMR